MPLGCWKTKSGFTIEALILVCRVEMQAAAEFPDIWPLSRIDSLRERSIFFVMDDFV